MIKIFKGSVYPQYIIPCGISEYSLIEIKHRVQANQRLTENELIETRLK